MLLSQLNGDWGDLTVGRRNVIFFLTKVNESFDNINNLISKENEALAVSKSYM